MFSKVLIANRGEIALRIIKTAQKLNVATIAIFSEKDINAPFVKEANESFFIKETKQLPSYLNEKAIIQAAIQNKADAIHPGYGFLSEKAGFSEAVRKAGLIFIGPKSRTLKMMGAKDMAKQIVEKLGCPVIPGYSGKDQSTLALKDAAMRIGMPIVIKPAEGGGGIGMHNVSKIEDLEKIIKLSKREAILTSKNNKIVLEKFIPDARHIEIQVFSDQYGDTVHLFERDCSFQRKKQKIIEEAPACAIKDGIRKTLTEISISIATSINYEGAGTFEYLVTNDEFFFLELNPRLQVEHPVTEAITGLDLVEWQFRIASGEPLPLKQRDILKNGHSVEARIYAEDPKNFYLPSSGEILHLKWPKLNVSDRVDSGVCVGNKIVTGYDPLIAKIITHGKTREIAINRLKKAIKCVEIAGLKVNLWFLSNLLETNEFKNNTNKVDTIEKYFGSEIFKERELGETDIVAATFFLLKERLKQIKKLHNNHDDRDSPWNDLSCWWINMEGYHLVNFKTPRDEMIEVRVNDRSLPNTIEINKNKVSQKIVRKAKKLKLFQHKNTLWIFGREGSVTLDIFDPYVKKTGQIEQVLSCVSPINGKIIEIEVKAGTHVNKNDTVVVVEAMKMEHSIRAPFSGIVKEIFCKNEEQVFENEKLFVLSMK